MLRIIHGLAVWLAGISMMTKMIGGLAVHLLTVFIAFSVSGVVAALISLLLPGLSTLYWIIAIWSATGVFLHLLTIAALAYLVLAATMIGFVAVASATSPQH